MFHIITIICYLLLLYIESHTYRKENRLSSEFHKSRYTPLHYIIYITIFVAILLADEFIFDYLVDVGILITSVAYFIYFKEDDLKFKKNNIEKWLFETKLMKSITKFGKWLITPK